MGVLDKVFAGKNGVFNVLATNLGGTVRLIYVNEQSYDETTRQDVIRESYQILPFLPEAANAENTFTKAPGSSYVGRLSSENDLVTLSRACIGAIPAAYVVREPVAGRDRFERFGKTYRITNVVPSVVGDSIVSYKLTGVQV